jgi:hypothetical protein
MHLQVHLHQRLLHVLDVGCRVLDETLPVTKTHRGGRFFIQRARTSSLKERRDMIDRKLPELSVRRQCELLKVSRSGLYGEPEPTNPEKLALCVGSTRSIFRARFSGAACWRVPCAKKGAT